MQEGWEYAKSKRGPFHPEPKPVIDIYRRRRWMRRLGTKNEKNTSAIFNLDKPLVVSKQ